MINGLSPQKKSMTKGSLYEYLRTCQIRMSSKINIYVSVESKPY